MKHEHAHHTETQGILLHSIMASVAQEHNIQKERICSLKKSYTVQLDTDSTLKFKF